MLNVSSNTALLQSEQGLPINTGNQKIYPKRMAGRYRTLKWWTATLWLAILLGPYLRWEGHQAILLDIPARRFSFFEVVIFPQDIWILSFVMLFFAMLLVLVTVIAGRVFCGFFCFQTVWTDLFMWIEASIEGPPRKRVHLDQAHWSVEKLLRKGAKHFLWLMISALTGVSFAAWFVDAFELWQSFFILDAHPAAWVVLSMFTAGTYLFAGFMREQVCFWLCPYARIQGVMVGEDTLLPTYDSQRGEPRLKRGVHHEPRDKGDCVDCDLCLAVCPTGVDIRDGQQMGCITCGLCIDACDHVMDKIGRPKGLVGYKSLGGMAAKQRKPLYKTPLFIMSLVIVSISLAAIVGGISSINDFSLSVSHQRQPEFITLSDGSIRNRYKFKIFNKSDQPATYQLSISGLIKLDQPNQNSFRLAPGEFISRMVILNIPGGALANEINPISFVLTESKGESLSFRTVFIGPVQTGENREGSKSG